MPTLYEQSKNLLALAESIAAEEDLPIDTHLPGTTTTLRELLRTVAYQRLADMVFDMAVERVEDAAFRAYWQPATTEMRS